jgi:hypothetical protein
MTEQEATARRLWIATDAVDRTMVMLERGADLTPELADRCMRRAAYEHDQATRP